MNITDFHCHLDMKAFDENRKELVDEFFNSGASQMVSVADPYETGSLRITKEILGYNKNISTMVAAHPHNADQYSPEIEKNILDFVTDTNAIAIGEAGLDFHYNLSTPENQRDVFKRQINIAKDLKLPLVIHSRNAESLVLQTLEELKFSLPVVFHCYTGNITDAREILNRGYSISISGIVTFKKSEFLREIAAIIPLNQLFTETDSPYLSPVPFRGKVNNPLRVRFVAETIAELKNIPVDEVNENVHKNLESLKILSREER
ncbi:MAG: TatD family hydrolase [bacterium]|nr:TatD family hydrolase [bacterium]